MEKYKFDSNPINVPFVKTKNRLINTLIPAPGTEDILRRLEKIESRSMQGQLPIIWESAEDFSVYDIAGNKYIDLTSTIFVANVGHSNSRVSESILNTLKKPLYSCYAYSNSIRADYLEKLIDFAGEPFEKAFLLSSGTEATEACLKLMRMNAKAKLKRRPGIICIENNWHGRTMGAQMMSSNSSQKDWIGYQDPNIYHINFPYPWITNGQDSIDFLYKSIKCLEDRGINISKDIAGFMLETFQGWGAIFYPKEFVQSIEKICQKNDIILAFDEMQSGFARTGENFGYKHYNVTPDLICVGKGMGGGVPLSGVIGRKEIMDLPDIGNMSSTHSANPLVCAAGLSVLNEIINKNLIQEAIDKGNLLHKLLNNLQINYPNYISYIFGKGLIAAILFKDINSKESASLIASRIAEKCMQKGLLVVHTGRESIKIGPPLTITKEAILESIEVIKESIEEIINND